MAATEEVAEHTPACSVSLTLSRDMLKISLSEMHHSLMVTKWGWRQWTFLYFTVSGTHSLVAIHQPPVLTTALGHDVTMPCQLSHDEKIVTTPVLYWVYLNDDNPKLWIPSEQYKGRVDLLDSNLNSSNKGIILKEVQWADSGKYLCKLSITPEGQKSFRMTGNGTLLMVYDTMIFNTTGHNDSQLRCEVNVTRDPAFVLSIFRDGRKLQTVGCAPGVADAALPRVTLSETISLSSGGKYECQLHLNGDLITKSIFHCPSPVAREGGDAEKNVSVTCSTTICEPGVVAFAEPWLLYVGLLLVPITILLGLVTARLMCRS